MAKQVINIGTTANDGTGDKIRSAFNKANLNFTELYDALAINVLTADELDAIQGANLPSAGNPFATMDDITGGGGSQDLQSVTDVGNETTNSIFLKQSEDVFIKLNTADQSIEFWDLNTDVDYPILTWNKDQLFTNTSLSSGNISAGTKLQVGSGDINRQMYSTYNSFVYSLLGRILSIKAPTTISASRDIYYPDASGTLALTSDIPTNGLPTGGTAGQILTKVDGTDYNATWQENYADWTSIVKHTVKNDGTALITKGTPVYSTGSNGTNILVKAASNASEATSSKTMGLMQSDITTTGGTQTGFVITEGLFSGLNTAGTTAGDPVWLGVNGALIYGLANKPYAPAHLVFIGIVTKVSAGSGEIFVKVQNGFELNEIHDVDLKTTTPINGHLLGYDGTLWVNKTIAGWLGFTPENVANKSDSYTASSSTTYASTKALVDGLAKKQNALGFTPFKWIDTSNTLHTGTLSETILATAYIPGGTFNLSDVMNYVGRYTKATSVTTMTFRIRINTTNTLTGATQIMIYTFVAANTFITVSRTFDIFNGFISGYNVASSIQNDVTPTNTVGTSTAYNPANDLYMFFTVQLANVADSVRPNLNTLSN